jgi:serine/threonine-protein kinase HipA
MRLAATKKNERLTDTTYKAAKLNGVFGVLRDAGPDFWGRRVIEKHAGKPMLGEMDSPLESQDEFADKVTV